MSGGPEFGWLERIREEVAMHSPPCLECGYRTFHALDCSSSRLTQDEIAAGYARRAMLETFERTCDFCTLVIQQGEKATRYHGRLVHYDCLADFELDRLEDREDRRA